MTLLRLTPAMGTHRGLQRERNEDSIDYTFPTAPEVLLRQGALFVVADGVGSMAAGDKASQYAVNQLMLRYYALDVEIDLAEQLAHAVQMANHDLFHRMRKKSATTLIAVVIVQSRIITASVGDSVIYLARGSSIEKLNTEDIYLPNGELAPPGTLTQALGYRYEVDVETVSGTIQPGDRILMCSDGITRYLSDSEILAYLSQESPRAIVRQLLEEANARGGADNSAAIVIKVGEEQKVDDTIAYMQQLNVSVSIDLPNETSTALPSASSEPATPPPSTPTTNSHSVIIALFVFVGGLFILAGALLLPNPSAASLATATQTLTPEPTLVSTTVQPPTIAASETPISATSAPTNPATATPFPTATTALTTTPIVSGLQQNEIIEISDSVVTQVRVGDTVAAFVTRPNRRYVVIDIFEDDGGQLWYRLREEGTDSEGWLAASALPDYNTVPSDGS